MHPDWASDTLGQMKWRQKAQRTVIGTGDPPRQHILQNRQRHPLEAGKSSLPAAVGRALELMGRHSRSWGQRDDSTSHRPSMVPENDDEAILPGRAFRGSFPQWLSECRMWPWPVEPAPCLYGLQDRKGFLPYPSISQSGEAEAWFWPVCTRAISDTEKPRVWRVQHPPRLGLPGDKIGIRMGICFGL